MTPPSTLASIEAFRAQYKELIAWAHAHARCSEWKLSRERFAEALRRSAHKRFAGRSGAGEAEVEGYLKSLHLADLGLACACAEGLEPAWEYFVAHFRPELRAAAGAILRAAGTGDRVRADELADSLYGELYGVGNTQQGRRKSLFEYFHGRSKLSTWLRTVLAQRAVDLLRTGRRTISLDAALDTSLDAPGQNRAAVLEKVTQAAPAPDPDRERYLARVNDALGAALAALAARERMLLAGYYLDGLTLAQLGRMLGEHESTISRKLDRLRHELCQAVTAALRRELPARGGAAAQPAMDEAQVELAFQYALEDSPFDLSRALARIAADPPEH